MKILIVEDEKSLRETIGESLEKEKFVTEYASDYQTALRKINDYDYDCVLLDIMLPGGSGLDLLKEIKEAHKRESIIIVSAKDSVEDKVTGLELGADDYLAKPFHLTELHARIRSVIRRKQNHGEVSIRLENMNLFPDRHQVYIDEEELKLNRKEFALLYYFVSNPNRLLQKTTLAEAVWGDHAEQADSLDFVYSQIKNLRKKMKTAGAAPEIKAVYGFGYKLVTNQ